MPRYELVKIRTSPNWYVQWFEGGHSQRISTRTRSDAEAAAFLAAFKLEAERHPSEEASVSTILDWYISIRDGEMDTDRAEYAARHLRRFFGSTPAVNAGVRVQQQYVEKRRADGAANETIKRELSVFSAALHRAFKWEKIPACPPMLGLTASAPKDRWLSRDEAAKILRHFRVGGFPPHHKGSRAKTAHLLLFTRLALYTGARSTAILDLTWDRVDLKRRTADLLVPGEAQTAKRRPLVPLNRDMVRALKRAKAKAKTGHVIEWRGERCQRIAKAFRSHMDALKMQGVTPHTLRHTFATWAARNGQPLHAIGGVLGQSVMATTARYAKHSPEAMRSVTEAARRK